MTPPPPRGAQCSASQPLPESFPRRPIQPATCGRFPSSCRTNARRPQQTAQPALRLRQLTEPSLTYGRFGRARAAQGCHPHVLPRLRHLQRWGARRSSLTAPGPHRLTAPQQPPLRPGAAEAVRSSGTAQRGGSPRGSARGRFPGSPRTERPKGRDGTRGGRGAARLPPPAQAGPRRAAPPWFPSRLPPPSAGPGSARRLGAHLRPPPPPPPRGEAEQKGRWCRRTLGAPFRAGRTGGASSPEPRGAGGMRRRARRGGGGRTESRGQRLREERGGEEPGRGGVRRERGAERAAPLPAEEAHRQHVGPSCRGRALDAKAERGSESRARVRPAPRFSRSAPERHGGARSCSASLAALGRSASPCRRMTDGRPEPGAACLPVAGSALLRADAVRTAVLLELLLFQEFLCSLCAHLSVEEWIPICFRPGDACPRHKESCFFLDPSLTP